MSIEKITHLQLVCVEGEDNKSFLQGQLSNDIHALNDGWQFSAYCTPKGRCLAVFLIWEHDNKVFMLIENSLKDSVLKRLRMYVMRSKAVFTEIAARISGEFGTRNDRYEHEFLDHQHHLYFGERCLHIDLGDDEARDGIPEGRKWLTADVLEGLPRVTEASSELFIPQMLNLDILNGISFKKGCYTGQEIVARMHYLGKLKQRSYVCKTIDKPASEKTIQIGEKISDRNEKNIGHVVNVSPDQDFVCAALRFDNMDNGLILESGTPLEPVTPQPYSIASATET